jgi:rhodanese-related sulfurtransferase
MFGVPRVPGITILALQVACLLCSAAVAGLLAFHLHPMPPSLYLAEEEADDGEVNMAKVAELEATGGVLWIDARVRSRYDEEHIPGALLLNSEEYDTLVFEYFDTFQSNERPIIIYCDAQKCAASKEVAERMRETNLAMSNDVYVLRGGWNAWKSAQKR